MQIGTLIPRVLFAAFVVHCAGLILPLDSLAYRPWEIMTDRPTSLGHFEPNRTVSFPNTYGDMASRANLPEYRCYRRATFTTDALGNRNPTPFSDSGPPDAIVFGSSYTAGDGLDDDQTLPVRLSALSGKRVYNAGGAGFNLTMIRKVTRRLGMRRGLVFCDYPSHLDAPRGARFDDDGLGKRAVDLYPRFRHRSLLSIALRKAFKSTQDDRIFPNSFRETVAVERLANGQTMLMNPNPRTYVEKNRPIDPVVAPFFRLCRAIEHDGLTVVFLLIPGKNTVYQPLLQDPGRLEPDEYLFLNRIEKGLRERGVPVINFLPPFRAEAANILRRGDYIFWPDDSHWSPSGVDTAAREILRTYPPDSWPKEPFGKTW